MNVLGELKVEDVPLAAAESDEDSLDIGVNDAVDGQIRRCERSVSNGSKFEKPTVSPSHHVDGVGGGDSLTSSLENLVNSFDEKLTTCFQDYQEQVEKIAPVQVRSQEEIMNECEVWWTITGNFGNMMPIDWSKSTARAKQLPILNLRPKTHGKEDGGGRRKDSNGFPGSDELAEEDDVVSADLDMHSLILSSNPQEYAEPVKSADEVIKEIDEIIEAADGEEVDDDGANSTTAPDQGLLDSSVTPFVGLRSTRRILDARSLKGRNLEDLSINDLTRLLCDVELLVKDLSEELVADLSIRDELEYEKELKNTFISLLLSIQSRRRSNGEIGVSGRGRSSGVERHRGTPRKDSVGPSPYKYLTTVIPYQPEKGTPSLQGLQVLVKILKAINEDSPAVPALLTDYILKVLCPS